VPLPQEAEDGFSGVEWDEGGGGEPRLKEKGLEKGANVNEGVEISRGREGHGD
jgi:hypothetical protein